MKITKLVHSCLIIDNGSKKILVDPGGYSWNSGRVSEDMLTDIDAVVITHAHGDHCDETFAKVVAKQSQNAKWYGPEQVVNKLKVWGISAANISNDEDIKFIESAHADLSPWFPEQPEHTSYVLFGGVFISGDCQTITDIHGASILAGAVNGGPWGGVVGFTKMVDAMAVRPKRVIPIHDWHWNEDARKGIYNQLAVVMESMGVTFVPLEIGVEKDF